VATHLPTATTDLELDLPPVAWQAVLVGLGVLLVGLAVGKGLRWLVSHLARWRGRSPSAAAMFGTLTQIAVVVLSVAAALTVVFPSVRPVNALGGLSILSIAAGIAFQTVLGNMFAGIVILTREVFRVGDQIAVGDVAGTVTRMGLTGIEVRAFDGRQVLVPNALVHAEVVTVQTGYESVRSTVSIAIDETTDLPQARRVAEEAMRGAPSVQVEPAPQALLGEIGSAAVRLDLRFWSGARQMETRVAQDEVIEAVLVAFAEQGVGTGSDVVVLDAAPRLASALRQDGG